ncbi:MAG: hypothetical protein JST14_05820 [Bacteroidetes bacterium]|nr:hypothetical protein [Bacteroidota bacterium]
MVVPKYTYDIFISYRHNDNQTTEGSADGWVSQFVRNLTAELDTMVKSRVSIYFDKNPHDGLKETDQVSPSLNGKLQSLILIPILSQTYCDTHSYAWQNEFVPFLQQAKEDPLGLNVRHANGNVSSRVLPVTIHDLDSVDIELVEQTLDSKLRAIPFVFKSAGVNRPLRVTEEDPLKNINRTIYRDQINKLAIAIKEIINTMRATDAPASENRDSVKKSIEFDQLLSKLPTVKTIAVLPLVFKSQDPGEEYLSQGFAEDLFSALRKVKALRLTIHGLSRNGAEEPGMPQATLLLSGTMLVNDNHFHIDTRLTQTSNGQILWQQEFDCRKEELFSLKRDITEKICDVLSVKLKESEKRILLDHITENTTALEWYWKGRYHWRKRGNDLITSMACFEKATELDPNFAQAHAGIANAAVLLGYYELTPFDESVSKCRGAALNALNLDPTLLEAYFSLAYAALCYEWAWPVAEQNFQKVLDINASSPSAQKKYKLCLTQIICNIEEAETELPGCTPYFLHAYALLHKGRFEEGLKVAQMAVKKDPGSFMAQRAAGLCYLGLGFEREAVDTLNVAAQLSNRHPWVLFDLIGAYATMAHTEGAQEIMEEVMDRVNALPARINDFFFQPN